LHRYLHIVRSEAVTAFILGALAVLGYAPFYLYPVTVLALAGLFRLWEHAPSARAAALTGFAFGLGLFGVGVSWIYVSLHDFGGMPAVVAALATAAFCAFIALFPALAGWMARKLSPSSAAGIGMFVMTAASAWALMEWVRGWIFTGFPWLAAGYSQIPGSPLAGFAPLSGIYGVSLATAMFAALLAVWHRKSSRKHIVLGLIALWVAGAGLKHVTWSTPLGEPISISLLQGNIAQDLKWREEETQHTLEAYLALVKQSHARLIVLPETALPLLRDQVPADYLAALAAQAQGNNGDILIGVATRETAAAGVRYFNSMFSTGSAPTQGYSKSHLVPFGEFIPFKPLLGWIYETLLHIPLVDLSPGATTQRPLSIAGQKVAVNICYEDAFGEEIIRQLPEATLLVNASNDAWYGDSLAAYQHLQMSQARALETGRMMLRATNTGATAVIGTDGGIQAQAPLFTLASLDGQAQGYAETTPYVHWGNWPTIGLILFAFGLLWGRKRQKLWPQKPQKAQRKAISQSSSTTL
jgi:apolipoprotein N-acyltransferase